jgi:hypothetical protein
MTWADECKFGSSWTTVVELEFHHVMRDSEAPDDPKRWAPFPSDAVSVPSDSRSAYLIWLEDGSPAHARWCSEIKEFKRVGDDKVLDRTDRLELCPRTS